MSLQIWMPLNGNLDNQGLSDFSATNTGATIDNNGKIGKCYSFNGNSSRISGNYTFDASQWSVAFWMNPNFINQNNTCYACCLNKDTVDTMQFSVATFYNGTNNYIQLGLNGSATMTTITGFTYQSNKWMHVVVAYNGTKAIIYSDGVAVAEHVSTYVKIPDATNFMLGCRSNNINGSGIAGTYAGLLNDFRLYDHCLSPKEVSELSKGLVLHLPLNQLDKSKNLLRNSSFLNDTRGWWWWENDSAVLTIINDINKGNVMKIVPTNTTTSGVSQSSYYVAVVPEVTYTLSIWMKADQERPIGFGFGARRQIFNLTTEWKPFSVIQDGRDLSLTGHNTFTIFSGVSSNMIPFYIWHPKLEKGANSNPNWLPATEDLDAWDTSIEYDTSGYCNNGSTTPTTLPEFISDSPRYNGCYKFSGAQYLKFKNPLNISTNEFTISVRVKFDNTMSSHGIFCTRIVSGGGIYIYINGDSKRLTLRLDSLSLQSPSLTTDTWYHICVTRSLSGIFMYLDGELSISTSDAGTLNNITEYGTIGVLSGNSGTTDFGSYLQGQLSDFRIYATALSATDILALYNRPASIADNGTLLLSGELIEGGGSIMSDYMNLIPNADLRQGTKYWSGNNLNISNGIIDNYSNLTNTPYIPINPNDDYIISFDIKFNTIDSNNFYIALKTYDSDKSLITIASVNKTPNTETTLAQELKNGDTTVTLTDGTNWDSTHQYQRIGICDNLAWFYNRNTKQYTYASRSGNVITLTSVWTGGTYAAGTRVANFRAGAEYYYPIYITPANLPTEWKTYSVQFNGGDTRYSCQYIQFSTLGFEHQYSIRNLRLENISSYQICDTPEIAPHIFKNGNISALLRETGKKIRYIRDSTNGSNVNSGNHWVELQAYNTVGANVAFNKDAWIDDYPSHIREKTRATDGITTSFPYFTSPSSVYKVLIVDLGFVERIESIKVWRYWLDGRTYKDHKIEVSIDGENWETVYFGTHQETQDGFEVKLYNDKVSI
ncbi:MAG: carbohydrate binding domain-containing protein [Candidatus Izemoplasmatales bacterium]|nr:carbohydrate binding domain-containing protein [Candidatus Izemoplasmatales bacterium]